MSIFITRYKDLDGEKLWKRIIEVLPASGEEMQTTTGLWFMVSSIDGRLYVDRAVKQTPSSKISMQRLISKNDFLYVYSYYDRWINGEVIGASKPQQIIDNAKIIHSPAFTADELQAIDKILIRTE